MPRGLARALAPVARARARVDYAGTRAIADAHDTAVVPRRAERVKRPPLMFESAASLDTGLYQLLSDDGNSAAEPQVPIDLLTQLAMYRDMLRIRLLDARMTALQRQGRVGFYGSCLGQEAPPIAVAHATRPTDWVFPALREGGLMLARGFPLVRYVSQVFGNALDVAKGRQMPSHMSGRQVAQVSWSSCIGTQLPHAVGAAWAAKRNGHDTVALAFCGDGATSEPDFHAALNFAGVFRTPSVFICQNNQWAISVPATRQSAAATFAMKGRAYAVPGIRVDGNDVLAVLDVLRWAVNRARAGGGSSLIECVTYRREAHSTSDDPSRYRTAEEVALWAAKDPVARLARHLERTGGLHPELERRMEHELSAEIEAAIQVAEAAALPDRKSLFDDVYADPPWHLVEQREQLLAAPLAPAH